MASDVIYRRRVKGRRISEHRLIRAGGGGRRHIAPEFRLKDRNGARTLGDRDEVVSGGYEILLLSNCLIRRNRSRQNGEESDCSEKEHDYQESHRKSFQVCLPDNLDEPPSHVRIFTFYIRVKSF